jgi:hypothetical protein
LCGTVIIQSLPPTPSLKLIIFRPLSSPLQMIMTTYITTKNNFRSRYSKVFIIITYWFCRLIYLLQTACDDRAKYNRLVWLAELSTNYMASRVLLTRSCMVLVLLMIQSKIINPGRFGFNWLSPYMITV